MLFTPWSCSSIRLLFCKCLSTSCLQRKLDEAFDSPPRLSLRFGWQAKEDNCTLVPSQCVFLQLQQSEDWFRVKYFYTPWVPATFVLHPSSCFWKTFSPAACTAGRINSGEIKRNSGNAEFWARCLFWTVVRGGCSTHRCSFSSRGEECNLSINVSLGQVEEEDGSQ